MNHSQIKISLGRHLNLKEDLNLPWRDIGSFDLVRWGEAEQVLNAYLDKEKQRRDFLSNARFTAGRDDIILFPSVRLILPEESISKIQVIKVIMNPNKPILNSIVGLFQRIK